VHSDRRDFYSEKKRFALAVGNYSKTPRKVIFKAGLRTLCFARSFVNCPTRTRCWINRERSL
jgi:hypothetical protein